MVAGPDGNVLFWNPAAERLYGYTAAEMEGQSFDRIIPEHARADIHALAQAYAREALTDTPAASEPIEMPAVHKSGHEIFVEFSVSLFQIADVNYGFAIIRDCTQRKRLEAERDTLLADAQATVQQAKELAALKADFSAMIAHEVGSPIAAIAALVELLDRDVLPAEQRERIFSSLRSEIHLLQRLVEDVQGAASMDRGAFSVSPEPTPLEAILNDAVTSARAHFADHELRMEPVSDVQVLADRERINQVLRNLLGNAAKHTPPGTPVTLRARSENGCVHIDVIDEGQGIGPEDLRHIFDKFGRGRDAMGRRLPGMGLGLYLSRRIVQEHGGELVATSEPGKGTTFSFDLKEAS